MKRADVLMPHGIVNNDGGPGDILEFQATSWQASDEEVEGDDEGDDEGVQESAFVIRAFGVTASGRSVCLVIHGFTPHFYIKLDPRWTPGQVRDLKAFIASHKKLDVLQVRPVSKKDFYGFRNGLKESFLRIDFRTLRGMKIIADKLRKPVNGRGVSYNAGDIKLYESNIEPLIRFMHIRNIQPAGWISVDRRHATPCSESRCGLGYVAQWTSVDALQKQESAPLIVASFDIECSSSHGDFPIAKKSYAKLASELTPAFKDAFPGATPSEYDGKRFLERCIKASLGLEGEDVAMISKTHVKVAGPVLGTSKLARLVDDLYACLFAKMPDMNPLDLLNDHLPAVKGDEIIQIGVTLGIYGKTLESTDAVMRHIFVLGGCTDVAGATVHVCATERDLLTRWAGFVGSVDPDVLVGYNILGFDMDYIFQRASELSCVKEVMAQTSRLRFTPSSFKETQLSSSALGDNILKIIDMPGRAVMDVMKVVQRDHKLDSYKLDSVAEHFTGSKKNDVSPADIFRLQRGSDEDRAVIAAYCVQDCELVLRIAWKLEILANNIGMANVCSVPLMYIFMRGQGVKIFSLVAKQCKLDNFLVPTMRFNPDATSEEEDGYEGAIVLEPQAGIYMEPVSVLDYASLYPSSMISENLSHDSIVLDSRFADVPGVEYIDIPYDIYEGTGHTKVKVGQRSCRFAQDVDGQKGVIPRILQDLVGQRKATRKLIEHKSVLLDDGRTVMGPVLQGGRIADSITGEEHAIPANAVVRDAHNDFQKAVLDGLQNAYKVTANSLYGALGAKTNPLYLKDIAACTTATGRSLILKAKAFVQNEFGARVIYGDSVAAYTPVLVRLSGSDVRYETIDKLGDLCGNGEWVVCCDEGREGKEACELTGVEAWTETGWTRAERVIRHGLAAHKRMVRVSTCTGTVDVTDDHSLLRPDGSVVSPKTLSVGDEVMHAHHPPWTASVFSPVAVEEARIMGMFAGCHSKQRRSDFIWSCAQGLINWCYELCDSIYPHVEWRVTGPSDSGVYSLVPVGEYAKAFLDDFASEMFKEGDHIVVPPRVLSSPSDKVRKCFFDGFETFNGTSTMKTQLSCATFFALANSFRHYVYGNVLIASVGSQTQECAVVCALSSKKKSAQVNAIMHITHEPGALVYDLTTENHHFAAGVGQIIVHNTDSIFCIFDNGSLKGKEALQNSIEIGMKASAAFKPHLRQPHDLEYEKTFFPFIILSKKRYVGNLYEHDIDKYKQKSMGIVLKRRDNANIVKKIYGGVIDIVLNRQDVPESVNFLKRSLSDLINGKTPVEDLVITKSLRASYKDPDRIAHQVLAKRMGDRDPGNRPQASDRIPFVYIVKPNAVLQGERIENPVFVVENALKIDFRFYIEHQIMKPVVQLYAIVLEQLLGYSKPLDHWESEMRKLRKEYDGNIAKAKDRVATLREREAQRILFDPVLNDIDLKAKGLQKISHFFMRS